MVTLTLAVGNDLLTGVKFFPEQATEQLRNCMDFICLMIGHTSNES